MITILKNSSIIKRIKNQFLEATLCSKEYSNLWFEIMLKPNPRNMRLPSSVGTVFGSIDLRLETSLLFELFSSLIGLD